VKIGGVVVGQVADIQLDPVKFDSIVTLAIDDRIKDLPADTSAGIFTSGLLGESYVGLQPGGDIEVLKAGDEIVMTQSAVDLMQLVGKYMFSGGGAKPAEDQAEGGAAEAGIAPETPSDSESPTETIP
jgi:phospholipid/cholesterol/gamma-HCH transport system substrate-binding protein